MNTPATYGDELVLALIGLIDPVAKHGEDVDRALLAEKLRDLAEGLEQADDDEALADDEIKIINSDRPAFGIEPELQPFLNAVEWRMEDAPPPMAENTFPYTEVHGRRLWLTNAVVALRYAFDCARPTAGGRS
jgi:hypothetical protein